MRKKKIVIVLVKILVLCASLGYIVKKIYDELTLGQAQAELLHVNNIKPKWLILALVLVFVNWGFESVKWKILLLKIQKINLIRAFKSVLNGITISIFTPNRVGEFGGRIFFLHPEHRSSGIFATLIGNLAQLLTTLLFGVILLPVFVQNISNQLISDIPTPLIIAILLVVFLLGIYVYFKASKLVAFLQKSKILKKWIHYVLFIKKYSAQELFYILLLSMGRYVVFVSQFYLLIVAFNLKLSYTDVFLCASQMYMLLAIIPTFAFTEVGVRGSVALLIFAYITEATLTILAASFVLWVINLAIPAILGSVFIVRLKI